MHHLLITNIGTLYGVEHAGLQMHCRKGNEMAELPCIHNAWLFLENDKIHSFGSMSDMDFIHAEDVYDAQQRSILPAWVDSHTHLVFAASRENEFVDRINGLSYEDIAKRGGGILNSAKKMSEIDEHELYEASLHRLQNLMAHGTGAIEIKSGYGLNMSGEMKMLRVIKRLKETVHIPVKTSFLAAHTYPTEFRQNHEGYLKLIIDKMLPMVADEGLADYMDVFCEQGFFSVDETDRLLEAGWKYGLKPKIHGNQLHRSGGVQVAVKHNAVSVDHLESLGEEEIYALQNSNTIPVLLPGAAFFLGMHYPPARDLMNANLPVCLATDYNPGTCPSGNVPMLLTLACTQMKMTPEEAVNAITLNGAAALEMSNEIGSIAEGKKANIIITKNIPSLAYIPYDFGNNPVERMIINGRLV